MRSATSAFGTASTGKSRTKEDLEALRGLLLAQRSRGSYYRDADLLGLELPSVSTQTSKPRTHSSTRTPRRLAPDHYQSTRKTRLPPHANREPLWRAANRRPKDGHNRTDDQRKTTMMRRRR